MNRSGNPPAFCAGHNWMQYGQSGFALSVVQGAGHGFSVPRFIFICCFQSIVKPRINFILETVEIIGYNVAEYASLYAL